MTIIEESEHEIAVFGGNRKSLAINLVRSSKGVSPLTIFLSQDWIRARKPSLYSSKKRFLSSMIFEVPLFIYCLNCSTKQISWLT